MTRLLATLLTPAVALGAVYFGTPVAEADAADKAACKVTAALALKEGDKWPKKLEFMRGYIETDVYKSLVLLDEKVYKLKLDQAKDNAFSTGNKLQLTLLGGEGDKLKMHAKATASDGKTLLHDTEYSSTADVPFVFSTGKHTHEGQEGKLWWAIQCKKR